jgi:drug/metabolite transporter (DMT)-like permease
LERRAVPASRPRIVLAFLAVYLIWGSTYLALAWAVEGMPPLSMAGARFTLAGLVLAAIARARGAAPATAGEWLRAAGLGALFFLAGNGGLTWAEARGLPTGTAAMLIASVPLWMILLGWLAARDAAPPPRTWIGVALGLAGTAAIVRPSAIGASHVVPAMVVVGGAMAWAAGSVLSRRLAGTRDVVSASAMQMIAGGLMLALAGAAVGEPARIPAEIPARAWWAFAYLVIAGSLVGFSAYGWLLRHVSAARVATYAYVNPMVAVAIGLAIGETPTSDVALAMACVIVGVVLGLAPRSSSPWTRLEAMAPWRRGSRRSAPPAPDPARTGPQRTASARA